MNRFDKFTEGAQKVIALAWQEAKRYNHEDVGTEHILLGIVSEGSGTAANALKRLDIDHQSVRLEVENLVKAGPGTMRSLAMTSEFAKVVSYAFDEARDLNHKQIGTEHFLLGLIRVDEGVAAHVLRNLGLNPDVVRKEILKLLDSGDEGPI